MSYDKNTVRHSEIDTIIKTLGNLGVEYKLATLGEVVGLGMNDFDSDNMYPIRRLEYGGKVVLETMERDADCDIDDVIHSYHFPKDSEPKDWKIDNCDDLIDDEELDEKIDNLLNIG